MEQAFSSERSNRTGEDASFRLERLSIDSTSHWILNMEDWSWLSSLDYHTHSMNCAVLSQSCPTLCDPVDCSPPGSFVHGIFQARFLEWVAISYSRGSFLPRDWTHVSCISCIGRLMDSLPLHYLGSPNVNHKYILIVSDFHSQGNGWQHRQ